MAEHVAQVFRDSLRSTAEGADLVVEEVGDGGAGIVDIKAKI